MWRSNEPASNWPTAMTDPLHRTPTPASSSDSLTEAFWGVDSDWESTADRGTTPPGPNRTTRWWNSLTEGRARAGSQPARDRSHRVHAPMSDEVEAWEDDRDGGMGHLGDIDAVEPSATSHPTSVGIDPLIARLGGLAVIVTLLVAAVGAIGSGGDPADQVTVTAGGVPVATPSTVATSAPPTSADATAPASRPAPSSPRNTASSQAPTASIDAAPTQTIPPTIAVAAGLLAEADPTPCGAEYVIVAGDFWIRLADAADVRLSDLLAVNGATVDTALHPGRSICLPVGASTPAPPPVTTTTLSLIHI